MNEKLKKIKINSSTKLICDVLIIAYERNER